MWFMVHISTLKLKLRSKFLKEMSAMVVRSDTSAAGRFFLLSRQALRAAGIWIFPTQTFQLLSVVDDQVFLNRKMGGTIWRKLAIFKRTLSFG